MHFDRCRKGYTMATHRVVDPSVTLDRIAGSMPSIGIREVRDITHLDRVGIPVFLALGSIAGNEAVFKGKGATSVEAKVSAMMEALERHSAMVNEERIIVAPVSALDAPALDPPSLILPHPAAYHEGMSLGWTPAVNLITDEKVYVPANAVFHPFPARLGWLFRSNTNGMASGNCIEEALLHALCEVIERDAWSLAEVAPGCIPDLVYDGDDPLISQMLQLFSDAHVAISMKDITSDIGVPTFVATADDMRLKDPTLLTVGVGTHPSPRIALIRALTEVAQSRLSQIYENEVNPDQAVVKRRLGYERVRVMNRRWLESSSRSVSYSAIPDYGSPYLLDDIFAILDALVERGMRHVAMVDLTAPDSCVPVVRVIVPGLEQCTMDRDRVGPRAWAAAHAGQR